MENLKEELRSVVEEFDPTHMTKESKSNVYEHFHDEVKDIIERYEMEDKNGK